MTPKVLFLDYHPGQAESERKLAGIRRFSRTHGWIAVAVPSQEARPRDVRPLLARHRPVGCVVEQASWDVFLPPGLFGRTPVVYLDPKDPSKWLGAPAVVCDNEAVARMAFRELSAGMPPCLAVVPSPGLPPWNFVRIAAFKALCAEAAIECRVFDGLPNEERNSRLARLSRWLSLLPTRSGVFGANDNAACDVLDAARLIQRHIPRELAVLGVDGGYSGEALPLISSVRLDYELAGYQAAKALAFAPDAVPHTGGHGDGRQPSFGPLLVQRRRSTQGAGRTGPHILEAVDAIRREACDGLTAAALAARFPMSRKHFERRFREAMGHPVLDEIIHVRLQAALELLSRPEPAINAVSDFCGFSSDRELRRLFRARFGISMRQWRNLHLR